MRSLLYVPGHSERMIAKAGKRGADAVIIDLEDSVPPADKARARMALQESVGMVAVGSTRVLVRVNRDWSLAWRDVEAAVAAGAVGVMLPKVSSPAQPRVVGEYLDELDPAGRVSLYALVEDARGLLDCGAIAMASVRLKGLIPGNQDLGLQFGVEPGTESMARLVAPLQIAAAAAGIGLYGSLGGSASFGDAEAWRATVRATRSAGFDGVTCIHPDQVGTVNELFTPSQAELERARSIVESFEAQDGGPVAIAGAMVDRPVYLRALRLLGR